MSEAIIRGFFQDDFEHTARLLREGGDAIVSATLSNNINIILAALDMAPVLRDACMAQENAENDYHACEYCDGERSWPECESCSERFGYAIDLRRAALAQASPPGSEETK